PSVLEIIRQDTQQRDAAIIWIIGDLLASKNWFKECLEHAKVLDYRFSNPLQSWRVMYADAIITIHSDNRSEGSTSFPRYPQVAGFSRTPRKNIIIRKNAAMLTFSRRGVVRSVDWYKKIDNAISSGRIRPSMQSMMSILHSLVPGYHLMLFLF